MKRKTKRILDAIELMEGDYVHVIELNGKPVDQTIQIKPGGISAIARGLMVVEAIPLTDEIFDLNGFFKDTDGNYRFRVRTADTDVIELVESLLQIPGLCDYVHELQNLLNCMKINKVIQISKNDGCM